jgi:hypothetical protein
VRGQPLVLKLGYGAGSPPGLPVAVANMRGRRGAETPNPNFRQAWNGSIIDDELALKKCCSNV